LAQLHRRIRNIRQDFLHKLTTKLAKTKSVIVLEDLNVNGMIRNRHLARHIGEAGLHWPIAGFRAAGDAQSAVMHLRSWLYQSGSGTARPAARATTGT